jgi:HK97 family phage prohead protease
MKKNLEFKSFEIKSVTEDASSNEMIIEGYGAIFGNVDSHEDIIEKGAFTKTLSENGSRIAFCYQHDIYNPIGKITTIVEDDMGLKISVRISDSEDDIKTKIKEGILKEMSIGFQTIRYSQDTDTDIRRIQECKLWEISLVTIASNPLAVITGMKSDEQKDFLEAEFDKLLAIESNREKKFNILKLKSLVLGLPKEISQPEDKPKETEIKGLDINKLNFL